MVIIRTLHRFASAEGEDEDDRRDNVADEEKKGNRKVMMILDKCGAGRSQISLGKTTGVDGDWLQTCASSRRARGGAYQPPSSHCAV